MTLSNAKVLVSDDVIKQPMFGRGRAPATCGELIQGFLNGRDFLVNSPIALFADVSVSLNRGGPTRVLTPGVYTKVIRAVRETLKTLGLAYLGADICLGSAIPRGKGLASSTSELTAAIYATLRATALSLPTSEISRLVISIDKSSDAVFLPGVTMSNHLSGELFESFGAPPGLAFIVVDTGGEVETASLDRVRARAVATKHAEKLTAAVNKLRRGFRTKDSRLIAEAATISAIVNQDVLYKPLLSELLEGCVEFGALGVNCAHTGTVLGVMFDPSTTNAEALASRVESLAGRPSLLGTYPLVSGVTMS